MRVVTCDFAGFCENKPVLVRSLTSEVVVEHMVFAEEVGAVLKTIFMKTCKCKCKCKSKSKSVHDAQVLEKDQTCCQQKGGFSELSIYYSAMLNKNSGNADKQPGVIRAYTIRLSFVRQAYISSRD